MMAALTRGEMCVKYLMFAFNFIFWLTGSAVFAVGLWLRFDERTKNFFDEKGFPPLFFIGTYTLIVAGALMMVVGFLGCCGSIQESPCMLGMFFFFLLLIFAVEVAAVIWGFSNLSVVGEQVTTYYRTTIEKYKETRTDGLKETLSLAHYAFNCCGTGPDFEFAADTCPKREGLDEFIVKSCPDAIDEFFNSKLLLIGGVGIGIAALLVFGMLFTMTLCCAIRKSREIV